MDRIDYRMLGCGDMAMPMSAMCYAHPLPDKFWTDRM